VLGLFIHPSSGQFYHCPAFIHTPIPLFHNYLIKYNLKLHCLLSPTATCHCHSSCMWESPNSHRSWKCPNTINSTVPLRCYVNSLPYTLLPLYFILLSTLLDTLLGLGSIHFQPTLYVIILITCFLILTDYLTLTYFFWTAQLIWCTGMLWGTVHINWHPPREGTVTPLNSIPC